MLAIKIILFCKYNKNWYRAWGKWHKIIFNKGKILIFFFFFFFVLNSWNASHENNFSFYENIMIKSMGKKLYKIIHYIVRTKSGLQDTWSAKCPLLVHCRPVHGPLVCMVWSAEYTQPKNRLHSIQNITFLQRKRKKCISLALNYSNFLVNYLL